MVLPVNTFATNIDMAPDIEYLEDGFYYETTLEELPAFSRNAHTKTVQKTTNYKNAEGNVMWSLTLKATFTYFLYLAQSMIQRTEANPSTCRIWEATICPIIAPAINPVMPIKSRDSL